MKKYFLILNLIILISCSNKYLSKSEIQRTYTYDEMVERFGEIDSSKRWDNIVLQNEGLYLPLNKSEIRFVNNYRNWINDSTFEERIGYRKDTFIFGDNGKYFNIVNNKKHLIFDSTNRHSEIMVSYIGDNNAIIKYSIIDSLFIDYGEKIYLIEMDGQSSEGPDYFLFHIKYGIISDYYNVAWSHEWWRMVEYTEYKGSNKLSTKHYNFDFPDSWRIDIFEKKR